MLVVKGQIKSTSSNHNFKVGRYDFRGSRTNDRMTVNACQKTLCIGNTKIQTAADNGTHSSMFTVPIAAPWSPFVGIRNVFDTFAIICFEPMHSLSPEMRKML